MSSNRADFLRGARAAALTWALLALSLLPSRLAVAMRVRGGSGFERLTRALAGTVLDFSHAAWLVGAFVAVVSLVALGVPRVRERLSGLGVALAALPWCVVLYLVTVTEQEVKAERGAFSTLREMLDAAAQPSFLEGAPGFIRYQRILWPALVCGGAFVALLVLRWRRASPVPSSRGAWAFGLVASLLVGVASARAAVSVLGAASSRLSPAGLGDPLDSVLESAVDSLAGRAPPGPLELLSDWQPTPAQVELGTRRLGWPHQAGNACPHPYARPLERDPGAPADELLAALERLSAKLFAEGDGRVAVVQVSLEGFRGDDLHALNERAAPSLAPFVNQLYARPQPGVLASRRTFQAGVRTAQGLAAMTCGLGSLPWNLSVIRDLDARAGVPLRCAGDVLAASGFEGTFFYGSDASYDDMGPFLQRHGVKRVVSEPDFSERTPRGAWGGVTDFALFDEAVKQLGEGLRAGPRFALLMSLSNHSPFTPPQDLPEDVRARAKALIGASGNVATADELKRLVTYAYTDAAVERLFASLERDGLSERTLVVLMADHSTGDTYVWGRDDFDHETDDAKTKVPFLIVIPAAWVARAGDVKPALDDVQRLLDAQVLSQNDVPALLLALLSSHPGVVALPASQRWHTLGGQRTSKWFDSGVEGAAVMGVNGVDESFVLDVEGVRRWPYEDAVFLRTRGDRERVTPRLAPAAATLLELSRRARCDAGQTN